MTNRRLALCTDQVVAGLSFGFWTAMIQKRYHPAIWSKHLRTAFPHLPPGRSRKSLATRARDVSTLRNRIWHHEPLVKRNVSQDYADVMEMLGWLCLAKAEWVRPHCRVPALLREKP